jgi:hypothetical protein
MDLRCEKLQVLPVDSIQGKNRKKTGKSPGRLALKGFKNLSKCEGFPQHRGNAGPPVVEVSCEDQGMPGGDAIQKPTTEFFSLSLPAVLEEIEVQADQVERESLSREFDFNMQGAAALEARPGKIQIIPTKDWITAQEGVAVVPFFVD